MDNHLERDSVRVGIWCAYHITLEPSEGIGVFAHNLARGLARQDGVARVDLVCRPGDRRVVADTVAHGLGKIRAVELPSGRRTIQYRIRRANEKLHRFSVGKESKFYQRWHQAVMSLNNHKMAGQSIPRRGRLRIQHMLDSLRLRWKRFAYRRCYEAFEALSRRLDRWAGSLTEWENRAAARLFPECDVWIIPYVGLDRSFPGPTVVVIHDLVCLHYPEMMASEAVAQFERLARKVAQQSTVAACMSNFIADNDLRGVLGLPEEKIRVVPPAAPRDFGSATAVEDHAAQYPILNERYVFYPSAFRLYKNHAALIEALGLLAAQGDASLQLVFTGIHDTPDYIRDLIQRRGLASRVHILGKVPRDVLCSLYQRAEATIVPSLYEQGSYPLMEALYWRCPIAASDIPSLRELFAVMGSDMLFFDPHNPRDLAQTIRHIQKARSAIIAAQQRHRDDIFGRTWEDAAQDWLEVLHYAIERYANVRANESAGDVIPQAA